MVSVTGIAPLHTHVPSPPVFTLVSANEVHGSPSDAPPAPPCSPLNQRQRNFQTLRSVNRGLDMLGNQPRLSGQALWAERGEPRPTSGRFLRLLLLLLRLLGLLLRLLGRLLGLLLQARPKGS
ncbi:hypothetical protein Vretifemale_18952 [Volvox reticuliferus]|uniref:Uncharacterized protein n=1 Tax=Volvox reticuliferus TaxID=1737510 RepID=A0A8J4FUX4_9CHLO|nr:hypothetical protein Vretifemale_18952 [Volvox reticuliferus]